MHKSVDKHLEPPEYNVTNEKLNYLKYLSLFLLTLQNCTHILVTSYSRQRYSSTSGKLYFPTTAVLMSEIIKFTTSLIIISFQQYRKTPILKHLYQQLKDPVDFAKICLPAAIYSVQNNLMYIAISNLEATTFQVTYQIKILTTGVFSVLLLNKKLSGKQWAALVLLFIGISLVQVDNPGNTTGKDSESVLNNIQDKSPLYGLLVVIITSLCSGFAGVYFEKVLKGSKKSLWIRNIQMSFIGILSGGLAVLSKDYDNVVKYGFFHGYDIVVCFAISLMAFGGLLVAVVVKYADNILKSFATTFSIILSCLISVLIFHLSFGVIFMSGMFSVCVAVFVYSKYPAKS